MTSPSSSVDKSAIAILDMVDQPLLLWICFQLFPARYPFPSEGRGMLRSSCTSSTVWDRTVDPRESCPLGCAFTGSGSDVSFEFKRRGDVAGMPDLRRKNIVGEMFRGRDAFYVKRERIGGRDEAVRFAVKAHDVV